MYRILIVDENEDRCRALAEACGDSFEGAEIYVSTEFAVFRKLKRYRKARVPTSWDVALRHYRNDESDERTINPLPVQLAPSVEIWYGASGEERDRGKKWNICRQLGSRVDVNRLSSADLRDLLMWAADNDRDRRELPELLRPAVGLESLSAMAVLCQGYLVIHWGYRGREKDWDDADIAGALEEMGWSDSTAENCHAFLPADFGEQFRAVRTTRWWDEPFGFDERDSALFESRFRGFLDAVLREWNVRSFGLMPDDLRKLVGAMCSLEADLEKPLKPEDRDKALAEVLATPKVIAEAYLTMARRLRREL